MNNLGNSTGSTQPLDILSGANIVVQDSPGEVSQHIAYGLEQWEQYSCSTDEHQKLSHQAIPPTCRKAYICILCEVTFTQNKSFLRHLRSQHGSSKFSCNICYATFSRNDLRKRHEDSVHTGVPIDCEYCGRRVSPRYLPEHQRSQICHESRRNLVNETPVPDRLESNIAGNDPLLAALDLAKFFDPLRFANMQCERLGPYALGDRERRNQYLYQKIIALGVLRAHISAHIALVSDPDDPLKLSLAAMVIAIFEGFGKHGNKDESTIHASGAFHLRKPSIAFESLKDMFGFGTEDKLQGVTNEMCSRILWQTDSQRPAYQRFEQVIKKSEVWTASKPSWTISTGRACCNNPCCTCNESSCTCA